MANINKILNKVKRALNAKGIMPLINQEQFYGDNGSYTKYILHYGIPRGKDNNVIAIVYGKTNLLKTLIIILKLGSIDIDTIIEAFQAGDADG